MRYARWLVPLLLVVPLAAPEDASTFVGGRAHALLDAAPTFSPSPADASGRTEGDGIVDVASWIVEPERASPQPPAADWSFGPDFITPAIPLESTGAPPPGPSPEPAPGTPPHKEDPAPPEAPVETMPGVDPDPEPSPKPAPEPAPDPSPEPEPLPSPPPSCFLVCLGFDLLDWL